MIYILWTHQTRPWSCGPTFDMSHGCKRIEKNRLSVGQRMSRKTGSAISSLKQTSLYSSTVSETHWTVCIVLQREAAWGLLKLKQTRAQEVPRPIANFPTSEPLNLSKTRRTDHSSRVMTPKEERQNVENVARFWLCRECTRRMQMFLKLLDVNYQGHVDRV